ncbi:MAG: CRTAC1 family protein [Verrucomicrobia bacterium]|nr:CRTAC1 family protein [Verrucomicrobiota bacterium]
MFLPTSGSAALVQKDTIQKDPFCAVTNLEISSLSLRLPSFTQAASTRRMVERLAKIERDVDPRNMRFQDERMVQMLRSQVRVETNSQAQLELRFDLGVSLLQAGETAQALHELESLEQFVNSNGGHFSEQGRIDLRLRKAVTMLRLGEEENCLLNHNADSCIFPLRPSGFHQLPRGSRGAVTLLQEQLTEFPSDLASRWLLNIAHMTLGEYPEKVPSRWVIPPKVFASEYDMPRFPDVAGAVGLDTENLAGGCVLDDFDNDGLIDVVTSSMSLHGQLRYFHNDGNGQFTERTREAGLIGLVGGLNVQQTDYNNDGWLDLLVMRGAWLFKAGRMPSSLLRNNGDGTFTDVTEEAGLLSFHPTQTAVWLDYNGDGWLDLFVGNETVDPNDPDPCQLFRNNRNGTFTECAAVSGLQVSRFVKGVAAADYDNDGRPDLYLSCRDGKNMLFHNDGVTDLATGEWTFSEVTGQAGVGGPRYSFPTWFFDYDNDGWEDLFVSGYKIRNVADVAADYLGLPNQGTKPKLYHNNHDGTFTDVTVDMHLDHVYHSMGANFGDLDNDGWLDFYLGTGDPDFMTLIPNRMLRNAGGKAFQDVTTAGGFGHLQKGHGVGFADLDNDGDQDVYLVVGGAYPGDHYRNALFLNPGNTNHWLKLKLEGVTSNRAAIGARIQVNVSTAGVARSIHKTVNSGGSFGCSPLRQEIGLGQATSIDSIEVYWPATRQRQKLTGFALDRAYRIQEGADSAAPIPLKRFQIDPNSKTKHAHPAHAGL